MGFDYLESMSTGLRGLGGRALDGVEFALGVGPQVKQDYPLNLSISVSGGKETNKDSLSNGE